MSAFTTAIEYDITVKVNTSPLFLWKGDSRMERILIIGTNGAGKSTFARALSEKTGIPLTHLDQLYWQGQWQTVSREIFLAQVEQVVSTEKWIIDGNNLRSIAPRLAAADTVFWLELPALRCVLNVIRRELRFRGRARPDMPPSCISRIDPKFLWTVLRFNSKNRKKILENLKQYPHIKLYHFRNYRQIRNFLANKKDRHS